MMERSDKDSLDYKGLNLNDIETWYQILDDECSKLMIEAKIIPSEIILLSGKSFDSMIENFPLLEEKRIYKLKEYLKQTKIIKDKFFNPIPKLVANEVLKYLEKLELFLEQEKINNDGWINILFAGLTSNDLIRIKDKMKDENINFEGKQFKDVKEQIREILDRNSESYYIGKLFNYAPQRYHDISVENYCNGFYELYKCSKVNENSAIDTFYTHLPSILKTELDRCDRNITEIKKYSKLSELIKVIKNLPIVKNPSRFIIHQKKKKFGSITKKVTNKSFKCYRCKKIVHLANNCPLNKNKTKKI